MACYVDKRRGDCEGALCSTCGNCALHCPGHDE